MSICAYVPWLRWDGEFWASRVNEDDVFMQSVTQGVQRKNSECLPTGVEPIQKLTFQPIITYLSIILFASPCQGILKKETVTESNTINWRDTTHFDSEDDYCTGCRNVSHCQQQQSYSGLRSPERSNSTYFWNNSWVQTFHSLKSVNWDKSNIALLHINNQKVER